MWWIQDPNDPSGDSAYKFEKIFHERYNNFKKITKDKKVNPVTLFGEIKNEIKEVTDLLTKDLST